MMSRNHILLGNRCLFQQQHVDCKIADTLLKKETKQRVDGWDSTWDSSGKEWSHMVLHLTNAEGDFGVTFNDNDITKDTTFYTTTSRFVTWIGISTQERQGLWLTNDDLQESVCWSSDALVVLRDIHSQGHGAPPVSDWYESSCWSQLTRQ